MPRYTMAPELTDDYISTVWETLSQHVRPTLLLQNLPLSAQLGCELTIATETFQYTGSFKFRAAYNLLSSVPQQHIVAASSGNFGQAVAYACKLLGKTCIIVMPTTPPTLKMPAVQYSAGTADPVYVCEVRPATRDSQLMVSYQ